MALALLYTDKVKYSKCWLDARELTNRGDRRHTCPILRRSEKIDGGWQPAEPIQPSEWEQLDLYYTARGREIADFLSLSALASAQKFGRITTNNAISSILWTRRGRKSAKRWFSESRAICWERTCHRLLEKISKYKRIYIPWNVGSWLFSPG